MNSSIPHGDGGAGPHDDPARWAPRLGEIIDEQCRLCRELESLSVQQRSVIDSGDTDALLRLLAGRQALIDDVASLNVELEPFRRIWGDLMQKLRPEARRSLDDRLDELSRLMECVRRRDDADRAVLESRRQAVSDELRSVSRSRGAVAAYSRPGAGGAQYQDRQA